MHILKRNHLSFNSSIIHTLSSKSHGKTKYTIITVFHLLFSPPLHHLVESFLLVSHPCLMNHSLEQQCFLLNWSNWPVLQLAVNRNTFCDFKHCSPPTGYIISIYYFNFKTNCIKTLFLHKNLHLNLHNSCNIIARYLEQTSVL